MFYKTFNTAGGIGQRTNAFYGLNRRKKGQEGECVTCKNVKGDEFPVLSSRKGCNAELSIPEGTTKIYAYLPEEDGSFTGVVKIDDILKFYYKGEEKTGVEIADTACELLRTDGKIIIYPQMLEFEVYKEDAELKNLGRNFVIHNGDLSGSVWFLYSSGSVVISALLKKGTPQKDFSLGELVYYTFTEKIYDGKTNPFICSYNESRYDEEPEIRAVLSLISDEDNENTHLDLYDKDGEPYKVNDSEQIKSWPGKLKVEKYIPHMNNFCIFENRLWGTAKSGENIYASAPGEYDTFFRYNNLATDSWSVDIPEYNKPFTGIAVYNQAVYCFKADRIYVIYGSYAQNFSIDRTMEGCGCIDRKSVIVINNALYWLGYNGIYRYTGGVPKIISNNLGKKYVNATAIAGGRVIYWNLTDDKGESELLTYDTEYGLWHSLGDIKYEGGGQIGNRIFAYTNEDKPQIHELEAGDYGEWSFESVDFYNDTFENTGTFQLHIRADLKKGSSIKVEYKGSGESEWQDLGGYEAEVDISIKECFVPRFSNFPSYRYRLSGAGEVYIYELERVFYKGGGKFK